MSALTGQLQPQTGPWGKKGLKRMQALPKNPQENLAQVQDWLKEWGAKGMEKYQPTAATGVTPTGGTTSNPVTDPVTTTTIKKESTGSGLDPAKLNLQTTVANGAPQSTSNNTAPPASGNTTTPAGTPVTPPEANGPTAAKPAYTPPAGTKENPGDPPAGILPGTPAYSAWLKNLPAAPPPPVDPATGGTPTGDPAKPAGGGLTFKRGEGLQTRRPGGKGWAGKGIMRQVMMPDVTITEEQLAKLTPEQRKELEAIAASGDGMSGLSSLMMKYWGDPVMSELFQSIRKGGMGGATLSNAAKGRMGGNFSMTPGQTGIKWMDKKYADNMWAKDPNNPANQPKEPTPASGNGKWVQGRQGPVWQPGPAGPGLDQWGNPEGTMYAGGSPGWSTGGNSYDPNQSGPNPYMQWMQQQFMQQNGMR